MHRPSLRILGTLVSLGTLAGGCTGSAEPLPLVELDFEITLSENISTVANASWTRQEKTAVETWLEMGLNGDYSLTAPVEMGSTRDLDALLAAVPAGV